MRMLNDDLQGDELTSTVCRFEEEIRDHDLKDMESTPLLHLYLICLWVAGIPLGNSALELYTGIIQLLLSRAEKIHGRFHSSCNMLLSDVPECFRKHNHCYSYYTFLLTLGKLSFKTLFSGKKENKLVFDKHVAEKYLNQEDLNLSLRTGILSESKVKSLINVSCKVSFSHKTVQEYFSAIYISFQDTIEVQQLILEECNCLQKILDMTKVFIFISNMNPKLLTAVSSAFMPVMNNDEKTSKYRINADFGYRYIDPLKELQDMYISCIKEREDNKDIKLYLQDFFINERCQHEDFFKKLQHLCYQNKENIKSLMIENESICSLQTIVSLLALSDLSNLVKLYYKGATEEKEMMSLLLSPLKCLNVISCKWENNKFKEENCKLSSEINRRLVKLQHLECLNMSCFTMPHEVMETLLNFLTGKTSMKDIKLYNLYCSDHSNSCSGFNLGLSQHSHLQSLGLHEIPVSQLKLNASSLEECIVGKLYTAGVVSSYLSQIKEASNLLTFRCASDIETMLQTLTLLHYVKDVRMSGINLGERALSLSPKIEYVFLENMTMSCSVLHALITVINKVSHSVTIQMRGCDIKPKAEFENFKTLVKHSNNFVVFFDGFIRSGMHAFEFRTTESK